MRVEVHFDSRMHSDEAISHISGGQHGQESEEGEESENGEERREEDREEDQEGRQEEEVTSLELEAGCVSPASSLEADKQFAHRRSHVVRLLPDTNSTADVDEDGVGEVASRKIGIASRKNLVSNDIGSNGRIVISEPNFRIEDSERETIRSDQSASRASSRADASHAARHHNPIIIPEIPAKDARAS